MRPKQIIIIAQSVILLLCVYAYGQAPAPPLYGSQVLVSLSEKVLCSNPILSAIRQWAELRGMVVVENSHTSTSIDVEIRPTKLAFEQQCMIFGVGYHQNPRMRQKLLGLLADLGGDSTKFDPSKIQQLGFTAAEADHLRDHLNYFLDTDSKAHPVRYYRVTYSLTPNNEYTVNMGTLEKTPSERHDWEFGDLISIIKKAAYCSHKT